MVLRICSKWETCFLNFQSHKKTPSNVKNLMKWLETGERKSNCLILDATYVNNKESKLSILPARYAIMTSVTDVWFFVQKIIWWNVNIEMQGVTIALFKGLKRLIKHGHHVAVVIMTYAKDACHFAEVIIWCKKHQDQQLSDVIFVKKSQG